MIRPDVPARASRQLATLTMFASALAAPAGAAPPPEGAQGVLQEIVVSARRREEPLQKVPVSVAALSSAELESRSLGTMRDLGKATPNLDFSNHGVMASSTGIVMIRGIGQIEAQISADPGVGVYVDGVYLGRLQGLEFDLLDLDRIEVLRGPQGTLFGKNTTGGAINVVSKLPSQNFEGSVGATVGRFGRRDLRGSINLPLTDTLAARISLASKNSDGFGRRVPFDGLGVHEDTGDQDRLMGRAQVLWRATDSFQLQGSLDLARTDERGTARDVRQILQIPNVAFVNSLIEPDYDDRFLTRDEFTSYASGPNANQADTKGASLTAIWDLPSLQLKSISSYRSVETFNGVDPDGSPHDIVSATHDIEQEQYSQELQANGTALDDKLTWTGGVYYFWEDVSQLQLVNVYQPLFELLGLDLGFMDNPWQKTESMAAYFQATHRFTDKLSFTGGLRYTRDEKEVSRYSESVNTHVVRIPRDRLTQSWDSLSPRVGFEYQWAADVLGYVSAARGYRSGGFNSEPSTPSDLDPFDPEYVWTYEVGLKSEWLSHRLRVNAAAYFSDYEDIQFSVRRANDAGQPVRLIDNAGTAEIRGFELELVALPNPDLMLSLSVGHTDPEYTQVRPGVDVVEGSTFAKTAKWSGNAAAEYTFQVGPAGEVSARLDYSYKSRVFHDLAAVSGASPHLVQDAFGLLDARLTYSDARDVWSVALYGTNLTDERYIYGGTDYSNGLGFTEVQPGRPREWGVTLGYSF